MSDYFDPPPFDLPDRREGSPLFGDEPVLETKQRSDDVRTVFKALWLIVAALTIGAALVGAYGLAEIGFGQQ